jgi:hypothetical protein
LDTKTGKVPKMTGHPTTPEEATRIKQYFTEKIASLKHTKAFYRKRLFEGSDPFNPETWDKIMKENPESAISFLTYRNFVDVYELLELFADDIIEMEQNIYKLNQNVNEAFRDLNIVSKKTKVDFTNIKQNVGELEKTILPAVKGMVNLFDKNTQEEERRKKNGGSMIV